MSRRTALAAMAAALCVVGLIVWFAGDAAIRTPSGSPRQQAGNTPAHPDSAPTSESAAKVASKAASDESTPTSDVDGSRSAARSLAPAEGPNISGSAAGEPLPPDRELRRMSSFARRQWFDRRAARATGLSESEIDRIFDLWSEAQREIHARIAADHTEGRRVKPGARRYDRMLREFLDDDEFDVALFATGQMNRVELRAPPAEGRAMAEGLQPGDVIESYDGERVFRLVELQLMIKRAGGGEEVPIVVRRGGEMIELNVPVRHPLGPKSPNRIVPLL